MEDLDKELSEHVPEFKDNAESEGEGGAFGGVSKVIATAHTHGWKQAAGVIGVAIVVIGLAEILIRVLNVPEFVLPTPSAIVVALFESINSIYPHFLYTLLELVAGYVIGAAIGMIFAAVLTQFPYFETIVTPYIILLITTPTIALVPLLMMRLGFTIWPRIIAVALASGPMVMINSMTGFRRADMPKIALARSYGATTFQIFLKIRFPLALPMVNVGLLVGGIFGLITAVGADMVGGDMGLGNRLSYYSSLGRMAEFFGVIILVALIGISIWIGVSRINKKWASWTG
ncbi:MAG: ABC transporter permease subunit [Spirochaetales bacterium]|nr:ABC transporter permease subunit [Spirochaetales bacterium]MCF7938427.1 ABC transporter permease subunit [Spirochaetales bacterium]